MISFLCEVKEVKASRLASGDKEYKLILVSPDNKVMELEKYIAVKAILVTVVDAEQN